MKLKMFLLMAYVSASFFASAEESRELIQHRWFTEMEAGPVWQSRNDVRIPGKTGTAFSLKDFGSGPFITGRIYFGYRWTDKSEFRALFAPLSLRGSQILASSIDFQGKNFPAGISTESLFRFNSYRVTYRYRVVADDPWKVWIGFTAKVRDAEISLQQPGLLEKKTDIGFVPLFHFRVLYQWTPQWSVDLDGDALAAPQGRAEDVIVRVNYQIAPQGKVNMGYRLLEGGADNDKVYTFSFLHYWAFGLSWEW